MKRNWIKTDRLWCLFLGLAVLGVTGSSSKSVDQVKLPIPTKESLPQVAEVFNAATFLEENDELDKNFEGKRDSYKRSPRKLGAEDLDKYAEQSYQGVMGRPGVDFPILPSIPHTDFSCKNVKNSGYYADPETDCQVFHICDNGRKISFLCPNGTVFRQSHLICDWWFRVDCERSIELYEESAEQLASDQRVFRERAEALSKAMQKVQTAQKSDDRVVTERSFGPSTTVFNSESRLPDRAKYSNAAYSKDENQVSAESASFVGNNRFRAQADGYFSQSKASADDWNRGGSQTPADYQTRPAATEQPTRNQAVRDGDGRDFYYAQSVTTAARPLDMRTVNGFQSSFAPRYTGAAVPAQSQGATGSPLPPPSTTATADWNPADSDDYRPATTTIQVDRGTSSYQPGNYQTSPATTSAEYSWNGQGANGLQTDGYQTFAPTTADWTDGPASSGAYQRPTPPSAVVAPNNWNRGVVDDDSQPNDYPSPSTTMRPAAAAAAADWTPESETFQPGYQSAEPTTAFAADDGPASEAAKENQVLAESASFVSDRHNQNRLDSRPDDGRAPQTNAPTTAYPATGSYANPEFGQTGAFSSDDYQRSPVTTAMPDYTAAAVDHSTYPPSGETLIPYMVNSLQTLSDNSTPVDADDKSDAILLYLNSTSPSSSASDAGPASSTVVGAVETTVKPAAVESLRIPAVLTENTKQEYRKLFKNDDVPTAGTGTTAAATKTAGGLGQGLGAFDRSSAELRDLAAVFTRALTAYLDDPNNFRKILAEVRPTEPPGGAGAAAPAADEQEVLDFSDDSKTGRRNRPAAVDGMTPHNVNALADLSTVVPQYTTAPLVDVTSKYVETTGPGIRDYAPPADSEQLQAAGSQSFYASRGGHNGVVDDAKTANPVTAAAAASTAAPSFDPEDGVGATTPPPVYFTTAAEGLETTVAAVVARGPEETLGRLNASDAGVLMNVMETARTNDTVKRLVLLLVNDPNKENSPEQTRNNIIEALFDKKNVDDEPVYFTTPSTTPVFPLSPPSEIPFGHRLQDDGTPISSDGQYKKIRKGTRRRVVYRSRSIPASTTPMAPTWQGANDVGVGLSSDSDTRAVELLKSLYSIASKFA